MRVVYRRSDKCHTQRERVGRVKGAHAASGASGPLTRPSAPSKYRSGATVGTVSAWAVDPQQLAAK
jgi:hypothetical protein